MTSVGAAGDAPAPAYLTYLRVRDAVRRMLDDPRARAAVPSEYWTEELAGFEYMLEATPRIIERLREHCYHLTGVRSYDYRRHHAARQGGHIRKLERLLAVDRESLFVPESPALGGFGFATPHGLVNVDTLKFYEALIAMSRAGLTSRLRATERPPVVVEIGAGWGGFAYQAKTLFPATRYVIIDLPAVLLYSAVYLRTLFPGATTFLYAEETTDLPAALADHDFAFLPSFTLPELGALRADLALNMASFQEMATAQVEGYLAWLDAVACPAVYSLNRERSPYNPELSGVSRLLSARFAVREVEVLDVPYTSLDKPRREGRLRRLVRRLRAGRAPRQRAASLGYRHLVATRRPRP